MGIEENTESKKQRVEFNFPMLTIRTQMFNKIFDKLGTLRISSLASWIALALVPIIAGIGLFSILTSIISMILTPSVGEIIGELGPAVYLFLPGINPLVPIFYGWIALVCAVVIHEGAHGIAARNLGFKVKSSGLLFFLFLPLGAFVDVDEKQIEKSKPKRAIRVMAAGVGGNIVVAVACLIGLIVIVGGLTPVIDGVYISTVEEGFPAEIAGLQPNDVFVSINNITISNNEDLHAILEDKMPGDIIDVTVVRGEMWMDEFSTSINLTEFEDRAFMGISSGDLVYEEILGFYQTLTPQTISLYLVPPSLAPGIVPYSESLSSFYTHGLGDLWSTISNMLFWLWFVNINLAIINALPIYPLDGGRVFNITLKSVLQQRFDKRTISQITSAVAIGLVLVLILMAIIPFII